MEAAVAPWPTWRKEVGALTTRRIANFAAIVLQTYPLGVGMRVLTHAARVGIVSGLLNVNSVKIIQAH